MRSADQKSDPTPSQPVVHIIPLSQAKEKNLLLKTHYQYLEDLSKENDKFSNFATNSLEKTQLLIQSLFENIYLNNWPFYINLILCL